MELPYLVAPRSGGVLQPPDDTHAFEDAAEHNVPQVQVSGRGRSDKELRPIGVLARVRHRQQASAIMFQLKILI